MAKWKEVNAYTGQDIEEDVPTNSAGSGAVDMNPTGKKKKSLLDARTKSYKEHKAKLEAARQKRLERKNSNGSKFIESIKEKING